MVERSPAVGPLFANQDLAAAVNVVGGDRLKLIGGIVVKVERETRA